VSEDILEAFNKKAKEKAINKSQWIENKMKEYIENEQKK